MIGFISGVFPLKRDDFMLGMSFPLAGFVILMVLSIIVPNLHALAIFGLLYWAIFFLSIIFKCQCNKEFYKQYEIVAILVFCAYSLMSFIWSPWGNYELYLKESVRVLCVIGMVFLFGFISIDKEVKNVDLFFIFTVALSGIYLLLINADYIYEGQWSSYYYSLKEVFVSKEGSFGNSVFIGWLCTVSLVLLLERVVASFKTVIMGLLFILSGFTIATLMFFAQSRSAYIGLFVGVLCFFTLIRFKGSKYVIYAFLFFVGMLFVVNVLFDISALSHLFSKGGHGRFYIYSKALEEIAEAPFLGHGFAASSDFKYINGGIGLHYHNMYLNILFFGGFIGLFIFGNIVIAFLKRNLNVIRGYSWYSVVAMSLAIFIFDGWHILTFPNPQLFMFIMPILIVVSLRLQESKATNLG